MSSIRQKLLPEETMNERSSEIKLTKRCVEIAICIASRNFCRLEDGVEGVETMKAFLWNTAMVK